MTQAIDQAGSRSADEPRPRSEGPIAMDLASVDNHVAALLEEVAETHHRVYRITDGTDDDWASWYADWLLKLSELPQLLRSQPVRSHLIHALVQCDRDHLAAATDEPWPFFYARNLTQQFAT